MTTVGDGEVLSRRELRARHPELFRAPADAAPEPVEAHPDQATDAMTDAPTPVATATDAATTDATAPGTSTLVAPAPVAAAEPATPAAPLPFALDLPPAPNWTQVQSPIVPPTIDVSAWRPVGPQRANTAAVWWIVFLPLLQVVVLTGLLLLNPTALQIILGSGLLTLDALLSTTLWLLGAVLGLNLVVLLLSLVIGFRDRAKLLSLGHDRTASPWWLILTPLVYLVIRTTHATRATGRGAAPLVVWIVLYVLPSVILTIVQLAALVA